MSYKITSIYTIDDHCISACRINSDWFTFCYLEQIDDLEDETLYTSYEHSGLVHVKFDKDFKCFEYSFDADRWESLEGIHEWEDLYKHQVNQERSDGPIIGYTLEDIKRIIREDSEESLDTLNDLLRQVVK